MFSTYWFTSQVESEAKRNRFQTTYHPAFMVHWSVLVYYEQRYSRRDISIQWLSDNLLYKRRAMAQKGRRGGEWVKEKKCLPFIMLLSFHLLRVDFHLIIYIIIDNTTLGLNLRSWVWVGWCPDLSFNQ